jgi:hypothetical protein
MNITVKLKLVPVQNRPLIMSNIRAREKNLYRFHGTHLSDIVVDIYLNNIQGAVETFMRVLGNSKRSQRISLSIF